MNYESLRTLYYKDPELYQQEYASRRNGRATIHIDFDVSGKPAFFEENNEVFLLAFQIMSCDKKILSISKDLPPIALQQYRKKCLIDEIVLTNKIEGVHSNRKEIGEALAVLDEQSSAKGKRHRFIGLVNKYNKLTKSESVSLASCEDIRNIYNELVLEEVIAEDPQNAPDGKIFRKDQTTIRSATEKVIHAGLTPERKIIEAMEKALAFLHDDSIPWLFRICIFHYMIEYIHPFYDGNGRLGRFILSYCIAEKCESLSAYRISETVKENIKDYYEAFRVCNDPRNLGDLTPFLLMMLEMLLKAMQELVDGLQRRKILLGRYEKLVGTFPESENEKMHMLYIFLVRAALFSEDGISTAELQEVCGVSYGTLRKLLDNVRDQGLLIQTKRGRENCFEMDLNLLDEKFMKQN